MLSSVHHSALRWAAGSRVVHAHAAHSRNQRTQGAMPVGQGGAPGPLRQHLGASSTHSLAAQSWHASREAALIPSMLAGHGTAVLVPYPTAIEVQQGGTIHPPAFRNARSCVPPIPASLPGWSGEAG